MKNRKMPIFLMLLIMLFIFSGCGKSEAVKNVESLISEIGEVTLENEESIRTADDAYKALTDEEKEQVKNRTELQDKKNELVSLKQKDTEEKLKQAEEEGKKKLEPFLGTWVSVYDTIVRQAIDQRHGFVSWDYLKKVGITPNQTSYKATDETHINIENYEYELVDMDGIQLLVSKGEYYNDTNVYVREEDFDKLMDKMFVHVILDSDNITDYFGGIEQIGEFDNTDVFGDERSTEPADAFMITSKAYQDKGLIMLSAKDVAYEVYFDGYNEPVTYSEPYIISTGNGNPTINHYGKAKGDIWYVKKEYVEKIEDDNVEYDVRNITLKDGFKFGFYVPTPYKLNFSVADLKY